MQVDRVSWGDTCGESESARVFVTLGSINPKICNPPCFLGDEMSGMVSAVDNKIQELQSTGQVDLVMASHKLEQARGQLINAYSSNPARLVQDICMLLQSVSCIFLLSLSFSFSTVFYCIFSLILELKKYVWVSDEWGNAFPLYH